MSSVVQFKIFYGDYSEKCKMHQMKKERFELITYQGARSIQPKFQPVRPGKEDHLKRWTSFFETFPVGQNRSIEFWTEISGNFGWMDRAQEFTCETKWHHVISVLQTAESQKCYHVTRMFEPQTKTNGPWSGPKKSACPRTSEMDSNFLFADLSWQKLDRLTFVISFYLLLLW